MANPLFFACGRVRLSHISPFWRRMSNLSAKPRRSPGSAPATPRRRPGGGRRLSGAAGIG